MKKITVILLLVLLSVGALFGKIQSLPTSNLKNSKSKIYKSFNNQTLENNTFQTINFQPEKITSGNFITTFSIEENSGNQETIAKLFINDFEPIIHRAWNSHQIDTYKDGNIILEPSSTYSYHIEIRDSNGNTTVSETRTITTLAEEEVNTNYDMFESSIYVHDTMKDTIYVFPGQRIFFAININRIPWNSYNESLQSIQSTSYINPTPLIENLWYNNYHNLSEQGNLGIDRYENNQFDLLWSTENNEPGINYTNLLRCNFYNEIPVGGRGIIKNDSEIIINVGNNIPSYQNINSSKIIISNNGFRGDINGDEELNSEDIYILEDFLCGNYEYYSQTVFTPEGELNIQRAALVYSWVSLLDYVILNGNYEFDLGQLFTYNTNHRVSIIDTSIINNQITITTENANTASMFGILNGEPWSQTLIESPNRSDEYDLYQRGFLEPVETVLKPTRTVSDYNNFEFEIPAGLENWQIEAAFVDFTQTSTEPKETLKVPKNITLTNYPNPFNPSTKISFNLFESGIVKLEIYNVRGQKVKELFNGLGKIGNNTFNWDGKNNLGKNVASGIYFSKLIVNEKIFTNKMLLVK